MEPSASANGSGSDDGGAVLAELAELKALVLQQQATIKALEKRVGSSSRATTVRRSRPVEEGPEAVMEPGLLERPAAGAYSDAYNPSVSSTW